MSELMAGNENNTAVEETKQRLYRLMKQSKDAYYDQYLNQMRKDLENGKATPAQINREIDRTYRLYQQRMGQLPAADKTQALPETKKEAQPEQKKRAMEYKIGTSVFSVIGAVFVLTAFIIFGFNFLNDFWQGMCLYGAAAAMLLLSEIIISRLNRQFSFIITGIAVCGFFAATIINYMVLHTINGFVVLTLAAIIAIAAVFLSKRKDSAFIRLISILGCYICCLPIKNFGSELDFLVITAMLFLINMISVCFPNKKNNTVIHFVHMTGTCMMGIIFTALAISTRLNSVFVSGFIITLIILIHTIIYKYQNELQEWFWGFAMIETGICCFLLVIVSSGSYQTAYTDKMGLFNRTIAAAMLAAVSGVFFTLLEKNKYKWSQLYIAGLTMILLTVGSPYLWEGAIAVLLVFTITKILSGRRELTALDCIVSVWTALLGSWISISESGRTELIYIGIFIAAMVLSSLAIKRMHIFHEIVITLFLCFLSMEMISGNWSVSVCAGTLFLCFLLFNHLPMLKRKNQLPYNIVNITISGVLYFSTILIFDSVVNSVTMIIGGIAILTIFKKRYGLELKKKYLLLAIFLTYMIPAAHFETSIMVSSLLMIVALSCVGTGFRLKDKTQRIYGLVMAMIVCLKLVLYDFRELEAIGKAALFLIVGIIALAISFLYIQLEKKAEEKQNPAEAQNTEEPQNTEELQNIEELQHTEELQRATGEEFYE